MEAALWGLLGTVAGAAASIGTTLIASRSAGNLQSVAAGLEREEKAREFQRATLIELQDAVHNHLRSITVVYMTDLASYREVGTWGEKLLPTPLDNEVRQAARHTNILKERVANDALRGRLEALQAALASVHMARDAEAAEHAHQAAMQDGTTAIQHIGTVLRSLY